MKDHALPTVKFRRLPHGEGLPLPAYASKKAAGLDVAAAVEAEVLLPPGASKTVPIGFAIELPEGFEAQVRPRSGLAAHHGVTVLNAPGTIDPDYRGEVKVILINHGPETVFINRGDRIAQLVIAFVPRLPTEEVVEVSETERGSGGFGSTGR